MLTYAALDTPSFSRSRPDSIPAVDPLDRPPDHCAPNSGQPGRVASMWSDPGAPPKAPIDGGVGVLTRTPARAGRRSHLSHRPDDPTACGSGPAARHRGHLLQPRP